MSREEVRKLLGGHATGTLTAEEQQALFEAALEDQELFDALAREQSLRDLLRDPAARAELLAALEDAPAGWTERLGRWMRGHAVGLAAVACFLAVGGWVARVARFPLGSEEPSAVERPNVKPNRVFQPKKVESAAPAPEAPPPPVIARRPPAPVTLPEAGPVPAAPQTPVLEQRAAAFQPAAAAPPMTPAASGRAQGDQENSAAGGFGGSSRAMAGMRAAPSAGAVPSASARGGRGGGGAFGGGGAYAPPTAFPAAAPASALPPPTAALTGTLTDSSGAVIPGAQVEVKNLETAALRRTVSGPDGGFVFGSLAPGKYEVTARAVGFKNFESSVEVTGEPLSAGKMSLAGARPEQVTVTATATPVQTSSSENSTLTDSAQMADVTVRGRDMFALLQTIPGVTVGSAYLAGPAGEPAPPQPGGAGGMAGRASLSIAGGGVGRANAGANPAVNSPLPAERGSKLDPALTELVWRARNGAALTADEKRFAAKGEANVRVTLSEATAAALAQLKDAGLTHVSHKGNEVSGRIAIGKLPALEGLGFVLHIAPKM